MPLFSREFWMSDAIHTVIALFVMAIILAATIEHYFRKRVAETGAANALLDMHIKALNDLLACSALSARMKEFLVQTHALMATRRAARAVIKNLFATKRPHPRNSEILSELQLAEKLDPNFLPTLKKFFETGILAMTLRWPETRGHYVRITVELEKETPERLAKVIETTGTAIEQKSDNMSPWKALFAARPA